MLYTPGRNEEERTISKASNVTVLKIDEISDRLTRLTVIINGCRIRVMAAYAPTEFPEDEELEDSFFSSLQREVEHTLHEMDEFLIAGDFNCRITGKSRK